VTKCNFTTNREKSAATFFDYRREKTQDLQNWRTRVSIGRHLK